MLSHCARFKIIPIQPYNFLLTVKKPAGWHWFTPFETWENGSISTGFWFRQISGKKIPLGIRVRQAAKALVIEAYSQKTLSSRDLAKLRDTMALRLGAKEDLRPLYAVMRKHPVLKHIAKRLYGMHDAWGSDTFPSLTLAVLLQMAPIKRSQEMWDCVIKKYGDTVKFNGRKILLWPTEEVIAGTSESELRKCKLGYRAKNLSRLARQLLKGFPSVEELAAMPPEVSREKLTELYGIGEYSADFADPHPGFALDVWSVKIFHRLIFGKPAPIDDPRSAIKKTAHAAEKLWGKWRGYILTYVLNDLPNLEKQFGIHA